LQAAKEDLCRKKTRALEKEAPLLSKGVILSGVTEGNAVEGSAVFLLAIESDKHHN
jgi:hypothetical protein